MLLTSRQKTGGAREEGFGDEGASDDGSIATGRRLSLNEFGGLSRNKAISKPF
jgi:hypothetical protein